MPLDAVQPSPDIPGFDVHLEAGVHVAIRRAPLTDYQVEYGCCARVTAPTETELALLCHAERVKAEYVALAEMSTTAPASGRGVRM